VAHDLQSVRSLLFAPADDSAKLVRAQASGADGVVADHEDAVLESRKADARACVAEAFAVPAGESLRLLRVNGVGSAHFADDLALVGELALDALVLPKATPEAADALAATGLPVVAIAETADGLRRAYDTACRSNVVALLLGAVDLGAELGLEPRADGAELLHARSTLVVDSAAAGIRPPFDCVHLEIRDADGLLAETELARALGLRGKACIHPAQVPVVNGAFAPNPEQLAWAREVVAAAEQAEQDGRGAIALHGKMVDAPVVTRARRLLAEQERIESR
jgi:citrate lyase beta subunit